jgi:hypothetical protein
VNGEAARPGKAGTWAVAAALLALFASLTLWEMAGDSLTTDERWHLPAGVTYWKTGDFHFAPDNHPPLARLLAAAPLLPLDPRLPPLQAPPGVSPKTFPAAFGSAFLRLNPFVYRELWRSRLPIVCLGLLLLVTLFLWSWRLHGDARAGLLTLLLAALEPTLLAHAHYVTTDMALAAFSLPAFAWLWRFRHSGRGRDYLLAVVCMGLALASKFSALVLVPPFLGLLLLRTPLRGRRTFAVAGACLAMAVLVQASYFFSPDLALYPRGAFAVQQFKPEAYPAYILGTFHIGNVWWYAPFAWLVKTPVPTILLIAAGLVAVFARRAPGVHAGPREAHGARAEDVRDFVLLPAVVYAVAVCALTANLGVRYLIPSTAFLLVAAGGAAPWLLDSRPRRAAAALLVVWLGVSVGRTAPHFISYFNEPAGGPANGVRLLHDSNVDWGQDLKRLGQWQAAHAIPEIVLGYWGGAQPEAYGVVWRPLEKELAVADVPPPGVYALSVNRLIDMKKAVAIDGADPRLDWLDRFRPADRIGYSIYIYRFGS